MPKLGSKGVYHTVAGDALAFVIDADYDGSDNPDDDLQLVVFASSAVAGAATGLEAGANLRPSHVDDKPGGFTPFAKGGQ